MSTNTFPHMPEFRPGWVWLAGAGPGDPGLLTLLTLHALRHADFVVYDALVDQCVLELARPVAERIYAGKRGGKPSPVQPDISRKLVELARSRKRVLRLKGGDPFVFGRGAEECRALAEANIPFRVVPGVTAGIGGLAYAGIAATDRRTNHAITFVTGRLAGGATPDDLNWATLAGEGHALVIYMALSKLAQITRTLLDGGLSPETPVAIVSRATTRDQKVIHTNLHRAAEAARLADSPAIVAIGAFAHDQPALNWFDTVVATLPADANRMEHGGDS